MDGYRTTLMKAIEDVVRPKMDDMSEKSWKWLHNNNYEQILDVDVAKLLFADGEAAALQQLEEARRSKEGEVKVAELQVENVQSNIEVLNNEQDELEELQELLRGDMLDLNYIERQILATLKTLNWDEKKLIDVLLFKKKDILGFKNG